MSKSSCFVFRALSLCCSSLLFALPAKLQAAPGNDLFAQAQLLSGSSASLAGGNVEATAETGEPSHAGSTARRSIWFRWTAPASASVTIDTIGSSFDTVLAVYTGSEVSILTLVMANDDINYQAGNTQSRVTFNPIQGTEYAIAVDGYGGASGEVSLNLVQTLPAASNDAFANGQILPDASGSVTSSSIGFTKELGEPNHAGNSGGGSAWFQWTAPMNGSVTIDTLGSNFDTLLAAYTGASVSSLTLIKANDDIDYASGNAQSKISFTAQAAAAYRIAVDGYGGAKGSIILNWSLAGSAPSNDNLASARVISGDSGQDLSNNVGASKEVGEPSHGGNAGGASIWYSWTAPMSGNAVFSTAGSSFNTLLGIYTGQGYNSLVKRVSNDDISPENPQSSVAFEAVIAVTYLIAVDGFDGASGQTALQWNLTPIAPSNDHFANALTLSGSAGTVYAATVNATKEPGEPAHAGNPGGASVWYQWIAPTDDQVTIDTDGSSFDTLLAVYSGNTLDSLALLAENDNQATSSQSLVVFPPVSGTTYWIAVDGVNGAVGNLVLNWSQSDLRPVNDDFANAQPISGEAGQLTAPSVYATKEPGEPNHAGEPGGASIWFTWTAPVSQPMYFDTLGSGFDTVLAVYTGSSVSDLTEVASNNNLSDYYVSSRVHFNALAGAQYLIAVDGVGGANDGVKLNWSPANFLPDMIVNPQTATPRISVETFASSHCAVVEGLVQAGTRTLLRFNSESRNIGTGDLRLGNPAGNPLFEYAPCHAHYHLHNYMRYRVLDENQQVAAAGFKTGFCLLDSNRWDPNASPTAKYDCSDQGIQKGWGDVYSLTLDGQWVDVTGLPDGFYYLEVTVNPDSVLEESDYSNNTVLIPVAIGPPANDHFASAQLLDPAFTSVSSYNLNATAEAGEPAHVGTAARSIWFSWSPSINQNVILDTLGSTYDTVMAVYCGNSLDALTKIASNDDASYPSILQSRISFAATATTNYWIVVDGYRGASGFVQLNRSTTGLPLRPAERLIAKEPVKPAVPPLIESLYLPLGELWMIIRGEPHQLYQIEFTSDLQSWFPLTTTLADAEGTAFFVDKSNMYVSSPHESIIPGYTGRHMDKRPSFFFRAVVQDGKKPAE